MTLNTEKLTQFAQVVGADVKEIKTTLATKADKIGRASCRERVCQYV